MKNIIGSTLLSCWIMCLVFLMSLAKPGLCQQTGKIFAGAIALNGRHGTEGAYAALRVNGKPVGAPDRSPSYMINEWERFVQKSESNYTYYFPLTEEMKGAKIDAVILVLKDGIQEFKPDVWITAYPIPYEKKELVLY